MDWKGVSYLLLGIITSLLSIVIYQRLAEPISSYIVEGTIKIKEEDYYSLNNENNKLIEDIEKLQNAISLREEE